MQKETVVTEEYFGDEYKEYMSSEVESKGMTSVVESLLYESVMIMDRWI